MGYLAADTQTGMSHRDTNTVNGILGHEALEPCRLFACLFVG